MGANSWAEKLKEGDKVITVFNGLTGVTRSVGIVERITKTLIIVREEQGGQPIKFRRNTLYSPGSYYSNSRHSITEWTVEVEAAIKEAEQKRVLIRILRKANLTVLSVSELESFAAQIQKAENDRKPQCNSLTFD